MSQVNPKDMSKDQLVAEIARLNAEKDALLKLAKSRVTVKMTEKGGISVYGVGRFPVTLYASQWEKLFGAKDAVENVIRENAPRLTQLQAAYDAAKASAKVAPVAPERTAVEQTADALAAEIDRRLAEQAKASA